MKNDELYDRVIARLSEMAMTKGPSTQKAATTAQALVAQSILEKLSPGHVAYFVTAGNYPDILIFKKTGRSYKFVSQVEVKDARTVPGSISSIKKSRPNKNSILPNTVSTKAWLEFKQSIRKNKKLKPFFSNFVAGKLKSKLKDTRAYGSDGKALLSDSQLYLNEKKKIDKTMEEISDWYRLAILSGDIKIARAKNGVRKASNGWCVVHGINQTIPSSYDEFVDIWNNKTHGISKKDPTKYGNIKLSDFFQFSSSNLPGYPILPKNQMIIARSQKAPQGSKETGFRYPLAGIIAKERKRSSEVGIGFEYIDYPSAIQINSKIQGPRLGSSEILKRDSSATYDVGSGSFDSFIKGVLQDEHDDYFALIRDGKILIGSCGTSDPLGFGYCNFDDTPMINKSNSKTRTLAKRGFYRDDFNMVLTVETVLMLRSEYDDAKVFGYQGNTITGPSMEHVKKYIDSI